MEITFGKLVSVILPVFNRSDFLAVAIESVLQQTYANFELLISDNCSTDRSFEIASEYADQDSRIKLSRYDRNVGCVLNYNGLIANAKGEYIALFGSDDIFEPNCLEKLVSVFDKQPSVTLATSARNIVDSSGRTTEELHPHNESKLISGAEARQGLITTLVNWIGAPVMWRSKNKLQGFDSRFAQLADLDYWCRILEHGDIYYLDEVLINYRVHENSQSVSSMKNLNLATDILRIHDRYREIIQGANNNDENFEYRIAQSLANLADFTINQCQYKFTDLLLPAQFEVFDSIEIDQVNSLADYHDHKRLASLALMQTAAQQKTIREMQAKMSKLENEVATLMNSKSWKITAPLREVTAMLKKRS